MLYHIRHVLRGGTAGQRWPASRRQGGSSGRKPHSQSRLIIVAYFNTFVFKDTAVGSHNIVLFYSFNNRVVRS